MSILEQESFISSIHPFENLTPGQLETFVENIDITYFKENEIIQKLILIFKISVFSVLISDEGAEA